VHVGWTTTAEGADGWRRWWSEGDNGNEEGFWQRIMVREGDKGEVRGERAKAERVNREKEVVGKGLSRGGVYSNSAVSFNRIR
jgi:hypothetical protein